MVSHDASAQHTTSSNDLGKQLLHMRSPFWRETNLYCVRAIQLSVLNLKHCSVRYRNVHTPATIEPTSNSRTTHRSSYAASIDLAQRKCSCVPFSSSGSISGSHRPGGESAAHYRPCRRSPSFGCSP